MRFGYWLPVFGGWLRNVDDERMAPTWDYVRTLARRSETWGYDLTLIAELNLNDIKGVRAPSLDAWSTAASLAAVTTTLELMVAVRPVDLLLLQCSPQLEEMERFSAQVIAPFRAARRFSARADQTRVSAAGGSR